MSERASDGELNDIPYC